MAKIKTIARRRLLKSMLLQLLADEPPELLERTVKAQLQQFKRLEVALHKFAGKSNGLARANVLRTALLPFLRAAPPLETVFDLAILELFVSLSTAVLGRWWRTLLDLLSNPRLQLLLADRNAALECVSRILARSEWRGRDAELRRVHAQCLEATLDYCIVRLALLKVVPISVLAFVGKVFAHAFYFLPGVAQALLFLLNVKQRALAPLPSSPAAVAQARARCPPAAAPWVGYAVQGRLPRRNCVAPPAHPVRGIRDPRGLWVCRWQQADSDVFNSFFRHYLALGHHVGAADTAALPGWAVVRAHVHKVVALAVLRPVKRDYGFDASYTCVLKLFRTIREVGHAGERLAPLLAASMDGVLAAVARTVSIHDFHTNGLLLGLVLEFVNHVLDPAELDWLFWLGCTHVMLAATDHVQTCTRGFAFLFNVWPKIPEHLRPAAAATGDWISDPAASYKFNVCAWLTSPAVWMRFFVHWNALVRAYYLRFIVWRAIGINFSEYPLGLITARRAKAATETMHAALCGELARCSHDPLAEMARLDFAPDSPMVNRKFGIMPVNRPFADEALPLAKPSELRKTHPYEIFDEAIYTCTLLPHGDGVRLPKSPGTPNASTTSIISLLGRFFKMLATDDDKALAPPRAPGLLKRNLRSLLLLRLAPLTRSGLSSPSMMLFQLSPNSFAETDSLLDASDDWDAVPLPPELFTLPPEIVRPLVRFDIVVDHDVVGSKNAMMQRANSSGRFFAPRTANSFALAPKPPRTPCISIYLDPNMYSFYVANEDYVEEPEPADTALEQLLRGAAPVQWAAVGKALNEWNCVVDEFERYLTRKVEQDEHALERETDETRYFGRIVPFLPIDAPELKLLNAT